MNQQPWYLSWPAIVIAFLLFWPAGIVLLVLRTRGSSFNKQAVFEGASDKKVYMGIGAVLALLGLLNLRSRSMVGVFFLIGGAALIYYSSRIAKKAERNKQYIDLIVNQGTRSIDKIASVCNVQYDVAEKEISSLISLGILKGASISSAAHMIEMAASAAGAGMPERIAGEMLDGALPAGMTEVTCPGCGAKVFLRKGERAVCEYCDAPLSAN